LPSGSGGSLQDLAHHILKAVVSLVGRDEENGAILEGQRNTEAYLSATRSFEGPVFFP